MASHLESQRAGERAADRWAWIREGELASVPPFGTRTGCWSLGRQAPHVTCPGDSELFPLSHQAHGLPAGHCSQSEGEMLVTSDIL